MKEDKKDNNGFWIVPVTFVMFIIGGVLDIVFRLKNDPPFSIWDLLFMIFLVVIFVILKSN